MDKEQEIAEINEQLKISIAQVAESSQKRGDVLRDDFNKQLHELNSRYSNEIRNISIASGIIAPLSLTLLQVEVVTVSVSALIAGFVVLILNELPRCRAYGVSALD